MAGSTYTGTKGQMAGIGAVVSIGALTGSGTETYQAIGEVTDAKFAGRKRDVQDATSFGSGGIKRKLSALLDYGQATLTVIRVSSDLGQQAVVAANAAGGAWDFQFQLPPNPEAGQTTAGDLITCSAIVTGVDFDISLTKASEWTFTLDFDGAYNVQPGH